MRLDVSYDAAVNAAAVRAAAAYQYQGGYLLGYSPLSTFLSCELPPPQAAEIARQEAMLINSTEVEIAGIPAVPAPPLVLLTPGSGGACKVCTGDWYDLIPYTAAGERPLALEGVESEFLITRLLDPELTTNRTPGFKLGHPGSADPAAGVMDAVSPLAGTTRDERDFDRNELLLQADYSLKETDEERIREAKRGAHGRAELNPVYYAMPGHGEKGLEAVDIKLNTATAESGQFALLKQWSGIPEVVYGTRLESDTAEWTAPDGTLLTESPQAGISPTSPAHPLDEAGQADRAISELYIQSTSRLTRRTLDGMSKDDYSGTIRLERGGEGSEGIKTAESISPSGERLAQTGLDQGDIDGEVSPDARDAEARANEVGAVEETLPLSPVQEEAAADPLLLFDRVDRQGAETEDGVLTDVLSLPAEFSPLDRAEQTRMDAERICIQGAGWDELWEELYQDYDQRVDRLQLPPVDFDYNRERLYDKETGEPVNPLTSPSKPEVMVAFPDSHPIGKYADVGLKIVNTHLWVLRDIILLLFRDRKENELRYALLPPGEAIRYALDRLYTSLMRHDYKREEYHRAFRMARWYGEYVIASTNNFWLVRSYESFMSHESSPNLIDGLPAEDRPYISYAQGWGVNDARTAYRTLEKLAVLRLILRNLLPSLFEFNLDVYNISGRASMALVIDGENKTHYLATPGRKEIILNPGQHVVTFTFVSQSDEDYAELYGMYMKYARFKSAEVIEQPHEGVNGVMALDTLIAMLRRYYDLHHEGKTKGTRLIYIDDKSNSYRKG